ERGRRQGGPDEHEKATAGDAHSRAPRPVDMVRIGSRKCKTISDCGKKVIVALSARSYGPKVLRTRPARMSIIRTSRWLRSCLLAIFVVAQLAGIVPLVYGHTLNALEDCALAGHEHRHAHAHICGSLVSGDSDHHHGTAGALHDQC